MNLSARLDAARRQREQGKAPQVDRHPLDLRYTVDGQTYDGRELRTGEELTPERWEEKRQQEQGLPPWRPDAQPGPSIDDVAPLIDLTRPTAVPPGPPGPDIELPAWARQDDVTIPPPPEVAPDPSAGTCANCGGEPRVDVLDIVSGTAHLECTGCGFRWEATTRHHRWPGRGSTA